MDFWLVPQEFAPQDPPSLLRGGTSRRSFFGSCASDPLTEVRTQNPGARGYSEQVGYGRALQVVQKELGYAGERDFAGGWVADTVPAARGGDDFDVLSVADQVVNER
jgi:hypothetical protein